MQKRVQIVILRAGKTRWEFIAHGAAWSRFEAEEMKARYEARGDKVRFLPIRKESTQ
jgi:hypothetical protein